MVGVDRTPVPESTVAPAALRAIRTSSFSVVKNLAQTALVLIHLSTVNIVLVLPQIVGCCAIARQGLNPIPTWSMWQITASSLCLRESLRFDYGVILEQGIVGPGLKFLAPSHAPQSTCVTV